MVIYFFTTSVALYGTGVCYQEKNTRYFNTPVALNDITEFSQDRFSFILTTIAVAVIITGIYILSNLDLPVSPDF